jgi:hypothetical protein
MGEQDLADHLALVRVFVQATEARGLGELLKDNHGNWINSVHPLAVPGCMRNRTLESVGQLRWSAALSKQVNWRWFVAEGRPTCGRDDF